jgi:hypothetical protein
MKIGIDVNNVLHLRGQSIGQTRAREALGKMAAELTDGKGHIRSGYLRQSDSGAMNAGGFLTGGSRRYAASSVRQMLIMAYGERLGKEGSSQLHAALNTYLDKTGGAIGTRTFVKLVQTLEDKASRDDGQSPIRPDSEKIKSRLAFEKLPDKLGEVASKADAPEINKRVESLRSDRKSPISDKALQQFQALAQEMKGSETTFDAFQQVMFPRASALNKAGAVEGPQAAQTFAMGDADGSMGRMVLHAIASGVAELPRETMPALAHLLEREVEASLDYTNGLQDFQADTQVSQSLDEIAKALVVTPKAQEGKPACIYLGDILSDRFTNNQEALSTLIHKLSGVDPHNPDQKTETGVRFIAGNHDTMPLMDAQGRKVNASADWGNFAVKKLSFTGYQTVLRNCFRAADYSAGVLTTHNGVAAGGKPNQYLVGVGNPGLRGGHGAFEPSHDLYDSTLITAENPQELVEKMNALFWERVALTGGVDAISTDFRPKDIEMTPSALGLGHIAGFRQLHGHNDPANEDPQGVINLNARGNSGQAGGNPGFGVGLGGFMPVGLVVT